MSTQNFPSVDSQLPNVTIRDGRYCFDEQVYSPAFAAQTTAITAISELDAGTLIPFEDVLDDPIIKSVNGELTVLKQICGSAGSLEFNIVTSGPTDFAEWTEISTDGGSVWTVLPFSLRETNWASQQSSHKAFPVYVGATPSGIMFRLKLRVLSGSAAIQPASIVVGGVTLESYAARLIIG